MYRYQEKYSREYKGMLYYFWIFEDTNSYIYGGMDV